jgi:hypothetical protein
MPIASNEKNFALVSAIALKICAVSVKISTVSAKTIARIRSDRQNPHSFVVIRAACRARLWGNGLIFVENGGDLLTGENEIRAN